MFTIQQRNKALSREEKLDFASETMIVGLLVGTILTGLLLSLFTNEYHDFFGFLKSLILNVITSFFSHLPGILIFGLGFRLIIYLIDLIKINPDLKMVLTIISGLGLIFLITDLFLDFRKLIHKDEYSLVIIYMTSFSVPFLWWNLHRNIWNSITNNKEENLDILDDGQF